MKLLAAALGLIILVSFGCNRNNSIESNDSQVEEAYQLIDDGQYTQAIDLFRSLMQTDDTPTIRIGLASAYAARAGILVQNYWDLILPLIKKPTDSGNNEQKAKIEKLKVDWKLIILKLPQEAQDTLNANEDNVFKAYENIENIKARFEKIPLLTNLEQVADIATARAIIIDVSSPGAHLYRALLSLILIRFEVNSSINHFNLSMESLKSLVNNCSQELNFWVTHLGSISSLISDLIIDLKIAYPTKSSEIEPFEREFKKQSEISANLNTLFKAHLCQE